MLSLCTCVLSLSCYSRTFSIVPHPTPPPLQGLHGDMVLLAGSNTGMAKVKVRLREMALQGVEPDIIKLLVIENMMLQPSMDVYILPLPPTEVKGHRTGRHPTRQLNYCVWVCGSLSRCLIIQRYICPCRIFCAEPVSMTIRPVIGHMPNCPLLTQTKNHNIQVHSKVLRFCDFVKQQYFQCLN